MSENILLARISMRRMVLHTKQIWGPYTNREVMRNIFNPEFFFENPYAHIHANVAVGEQQYRFNSA